MYLILKVQGWGLVAGLSTALGISTVTPSAGVFIHLTDFVEKANTAVHSVYTFQFQWSNLKYYVISTCNCRQQLCTTTENYPPSYNKLPMYVSTYV